MKKQLCNFIIKFFNKYPTGTVDQIKNYIITRNRRISPTHQEVNNHMKVIGTKIGREYQYKYRFQSSYVGLWVLKPNAEELVEKYT